MEVLSNMFLSIGTMDDNTWKETIEPHKGALYRLDKNGGISKQVENLTISNGLAWTSDKKTMYFVDSSPTQIYAYDYNHESGDVSAYFFYLFSI